MISMIEPYWEREKALRAQLESFEIRYKGREDLELVICDDGSPTQPALPVVEEFRERLGFPVKLIQNEVRKVGEGKDPCVPFNQAFKASVGEIIVLCQADVMHMSLGTLDALQSVLEQFEKGLVYPSCYDKRPGAISFPLGDQWRGRAWMSSVPPDCLMMRRESFEEIGRFDEEFREDYACSDTEFVARAMLQGYSLVHVPNIVVIHRSDLCEQWRDVGKQESFHRNLERMRRKISCIVDTTVIVCPAKDEEGEILPIVLRQVPVG